MNHRLIQLIAAVVLVAAMSGAGWLAPRLVSLSDKHALRYTDVSVEGAPPIVALGTAMGALRGLIVDYLWIKVQLNKEKGMLYEIMADTELITKLQPRFAAVWAFHGHNMAYNISVATHTEQERWHWVNRGIDLVRNQGIRYNPNDLNLYRELAFWFAHKIEGVADDAHLYYKRELAREWHYLLGEPPATWEDRIAWIKEVADAPATLDEAEQRTPGVKALVDELGSAYGEYEQRMRFRLDKVFLTRYSEWQELRGRSRYAQMLGIDEQLRRQNPLFVRFDALASDPDLAEQWRTLIAHVRKRALLDEYNMDPKKMYEYTRDLGPLDWRSGNAHSLYWARLGSEKGDIRVADDDDIYKVLNNDRHQIHAMQALSRFGKISFDPFSLEYPARYPEPQWIDTINEFFMELVRKHYDTRGAGGDTFVTFHQNFMADKVRELYRLGERQMAQEILDELDHLYRIVARPPTPKFNMPLDVFVNEQVRGEYSMQPHMAPSEVAMALRNGYIQAWVYGREEVLEDAMNFSDNVIRYFREEANSFRTKFRSQRMGDIMQDLENARFWVFQQLMIDSSVPLIDRLQMWSRAPDELKARAYDRIVQHIAQQASRDPFAQHLSIEQVLPPPAGLDAFRRAEAARRAAEQEASESRATIERK
jgi:hypothetical protein